MKRRDFLGTTALVSLGALTIPGWVSARSFGSAIYQQWELPEPMGHVRHGLLNPEIAVLPDLPAGLTLYTPQRFYRDGVSEGDQDLQLFSLELHGERLSVSWDHQQTQWSSMRDEGVTERTTTGRQVVLEVNEKKVELLQGSQDIQVDHGYLVKLTEPQTPIMMAFQGELSLSADEIAILIS